MWERDGQFFENDRNKFLDLAALIVPQRTAVQSGAWSDPATWGGVIPVAGDNVLIPLGRDVTYDLNAPNTVLGTVLVQDGALRVPPTATTAIHLHSLLVHRGVLQIGKLGEPVTGKFTLTFADADFLAGDTTQLGKQLVTLDARVSICGQPLVPFTRASAGITAGQTAITLQDDTDPETGALRTAAADIAATWHIGDRVAIPTTMGHNGGNDDETTVATIAAISGATITLASGALAHPALADISNMPGPAAGLRQKWTFQRKPWIINESRTILFRSANAAVTLRRGGLQFIGNHPPRNIGGHRNDDHKSYPADLGADGDQRMDFRWFAMEGLGRTESLASPQVGQPGNALGRWAFHPHHVGHWAMRPLICQGLSLVDFKMWGYVHDDAYVWYDWCTARKGVGGAFTGVMDTETGFWTRLFAVDVQEGSGGGEFSFSGHGRSGNGFTLDRTVLCKELRAANCKFAMRLNQNETDPLLGGYIPNDFGGNYFAPPGRYPDRENLRRHGGWAGDYPFYKHEDPMMGNWDDFEFYSCQEGFNVFHRQKLYLQTEMRSFFHRWNIWKTSTAIRFPNYTWNYTFRDCACSEGAMFLFFGDKNGGYVFFNCTAENFSLGVNFSSATFGNLGGGFVDMTVSGISNWDAQANGHPALLLGATIADSPFATALAAHALTEFTIKSGTSKDGTISGKVRDLLTGLVSMGDAGIGTDNLWPLGYNAQQLHGFLGGMTVDNTGVEFGHATQSLTPNELVRQMGTFQSAAKWWVRIWLLIRDRVTGDFFQHSIDRDVGAVALALRQMHEIPVPPPQPVPLLAPSIANLPPLPEAISYFVDPVHPVTYRAVTSGANVAVTLEATNRFLALTAGTSVVRSFGLRDASGTTAAAALTFDVVAQPVAAPVNTAPPSISYGGQDTAQHVVPTSPFRQYLMTLDRGRWSNTRGGWFETRLMKNGVQFFYPNGANPALARQFIVEQLPFMVGTWRLDVRFHNAHGVSAWISSNELVLT